MKKESAGSTLVTPRYERSVSEKTSMRVNRLEKSQMNIDTGAAVTVARTDIAAGLSEGQPTT
jgi:predicted Zn-dependent protease